MSRFDIWGNKKCTDCKFFRKSSRCPADRCDCPDNLRSDWMGTVYMKTPDARNWNHKCENYRPVNAENGATVKQ